METAIYLPQIMRFGQHASNQLVQVCQELGYCKPLIVTDEFMASCGYLEQLQKPLLEANISFGVFSDCIPDPTTEVVDQGVTCWNNGDYDCLVALGGGSPIDTAKAIAIMAKHGGKVRDFKAPNPVPPGYPVIAIPTTAGTGSEATRVMVITDSETEEKMMCLGLGLMPIAALVDYQLTLTMPKRLTADTGLDTLCHALEAYVSKKANPFTDPIALSCLEKIARYLPTACEQPDNSEAREALMMAATQGGMAFSNASVTLIHGMSRPIGAHFHVPHGMSNAMLLPAITEYSIPGAKPRYAQAAKAMQIAEPQDTDDQACTKLLDYLKQICAKLEVPTPKTFGIDQQTWQDKLNLMATQALASGSPNNNPVVPGKADIIRLYQQVYSRHNTR